MLIYYLVAAIAVSIRGNFDPLFEHIKYLTSTTTGLGTLTTLCTGTGSPTALTVSWWVSCILVVNWLLNVGGGVSYTVEVVAGGSGVLG